MPTRGMLDDRYHMIAMIAMETGLRKCESAVNL